MIFKNTQMLYCVARRKAICL